MRIIWHEKCFDRLRNPPAILTCVDFVTINPSIPNTLPLRTIIQLRRCVGAQGKNTARKLGQMKEAKRNNRKVNFLTFFRIVSSLLGNKKLQLQDKI